MNYDAGGVHDTVDTAHGAGTLLDRARDRRLLRDIRLDGCPASLSGD